MLCWLGECKSEQSSIGGKAFHLNRLFNNFNVPRGIILSEFTIELENYLKELNCDTVAVRSSASCEDGDNESFAGMHTTLLNVPNNIKDVKNAILECKESIHSAWANSYKLYKSFNYFEDINDTNDNDILSLHKESNMTIVIQEMINPIAAGVCFTQHPVTNNPNEILIEYVGGLGENLVSGKETPSSYIFERKDDTLTFKSYTPAPLQEELLIDHDNAQKIAEMALNIVSLSSGIPQDIEFAFDGNVMWLLQSRPITTIINEDNSTKVKEDLLSNRNTREVIPNPMTFMSWSAFFNVIQNGLTLRYKKRNIDYSSVCVDDKIRGFYELRKGYLYQNLSITDTLGRFEFGVSYKDTLLKSFNEIPEEIFEECCDTEFVGIGNKISGILGLLNFLRKTSGTIQYIQESIIKYREQFNVFQYWKDYYINYSENELFNCFNSTLDEFSLFACTYIDSQVYLELFSSLVQQIIEQSSKKYGKDKETFNKLLIGLGDIITHKMNIELSNLLTIACTEEIVISYIENKLNNNNKESEEGYWDDWKLELQNTKTYPLLKEFLNNYGHRAICELEVSSSRWAVDPTYIFKLVIVQLSNDNSKLDTNESNETMIRINFEKELIADCPFYIKSILKWSINKLQEFIRFRENLKDIVVRFIAKQQQLLLALVNNWNDNNTIPINKEDIFHISISQLSKLHDGTLSNDKILQLITLNKKLYKEFSSVISPPKIYKGNSVFRINNQNILKGQRIDGNAGAPGEITGTVVIIKSLNEIENISKCKSDIKILVTMVTDPAWTPLFLQVQGVIVETGGILSHAAIVAREFKIPCVFGVQNIFEYINNGDQIYLNGSKGYIEKIPD